MVTKMEGLNAAQKGGMKAHNHQTGGFGIKHATIASLLTAKYLLSKKKKVKKGKKKTLKNMRKKLKKLQTMKNKKKSLKNIKNKLKKLHNM